MGFVTAAQRPGMRIDLVPNTNNRELDTAIDAFATEGGDVLYPVHMSRASTRVRRVTN